MCSYSHLQLQVLDLWKDINDMVKHIVADFISTHAGTVTQLSRSVSLWRFLSKTIQRRDCKREERCIFMNKRTFSAWLCLYMHHKHYYYSPLPEFGIFEVVLRSSPSRTSLVLAGLAADTKYHNAGNLTIYQQY